MALSVDELSTFEIHIIIWIKLEKSLIKYSIIEPLLEVWTREDGTRKVVSIAIFLN
jgi:hypothetical protein